MNKRKHLYSCILFLLAFIALVSPVNANQIMASHSLVEFIVNSPVKQDRIDYGTPVHVTRSSVDENNLFYNIEYDSHEIAKLTYVTVNSDNPKKLNGNQIKIMGNKETSAVLQFHLDPDIIWQSPGDYHIKLVPQDIIAQPIEIEIVIGKYVQIASIDPSLITINADEGPGIYKANPSVTVVVESNHPQWRLDVRIGDLRYVGNDSGVVIKPSEMLMAINSETDYQPLAVDSPLISSSGLVIPANDFSGKLVRLYFAADIGWHHLAGKYEGEISITLEPIEGSQKKYRFR